jgi:hypothetical protein
MQKHGAETMKLEKQLFQVWHVKNPTFGFAPLLGLKPECWPDDYVHVADVIGFNVDHVFGLTQEWDVGETITVFEEPTRSTSVGDVVITPDGEITRCEPYDWSVLGWLG